MSTENQSNSSEVKQATPASASERAIFVVCALAAVVMIFLMVHEGPEEVPDTAGQLDQQEPANSLAAQVTDQEEAPSGDQEKPRSLRSNYSNLWGNDVVLWWDDVPKDWRQRSVDTGTNSNIRLKDLAGSDSCWKCHEANYELWSEHGHSRMTTHASAATIVGDFSGDQSIEVEGGTAKFYRDGDRHLMKLIGNQNTSIYEVTRTIGWRHEQEYAGVLISDPTASSAQIEHVLPFSYDIAEQHWMPSIHVWPDGAIPDPFKPESIIAYTDACSDCHMAYPVGDRMFRRMGLRRWAAYTPRQTSFHLAAYLTDAHPEIMDSQREFRDYKQEEMIQIIAKVRDIELEKQVPLQGITCEACHYGCRDHVENSTEEFSSVRPAFYPVSPHLFTEAPDLAALHGRNTQNINFMCARCHSGSRQMYANTLHAWNSTEYTEAISGHCYDPAKAKQHGMESMSCVHCHDPHKTVGLKWADSPQEDDAKCLTCHSQFNEQEQRLAHTHHASGDGSHCMDCHMPHTNEGLGRMVRTHRIVNPIDRRLIEANQVNVCNLCHLDKSIDWTIDTLKKWYDPHIALSAEAMAKNYRDRTAPVVHEWIKNSHPPTRIATAGAIARRKATFTLPDLLDQLAVENYGYNARMMQKAADELLGLKLRDLGFMYHFPQDRRQAVMSELKPRLLKQIVGP